MWRIEYFDEVDKQEIYEELRKKNPDLEYLRILWYSSDKIRDIVELKAIETNKEHFLNNMFQMIQNWLENDEYWIWEEKFNRKVKNFISKSDNELLEMGLTKNEIKQIRDLANN